MSRRAVLWIAFIVVHVGIAWLGWVLPNQPMGDVYLVYEDWSDWALSGSRIMGITAPFVYPQLALVPMVLAHLFALIANYTVGWAILVIVVDAIAFSVLIGRARSTGRNVAAWFWLAYLALLGPIAMYRIDAITVPIALVGCLWLAGRPWLGSALLAIGMWIKVWPAALLAAAIVAVRRRLAILGGAVAVTALVMGAVMVAGGGRYLFGFVSEQAGRGLQIEAPVSTFYMWRAAFEVPDSYVFYDRQVLTFQVTGPNVDLVIAAMTPLLALAVLAVVAVGGYKAWRGASFARLFPPLALALVLVMIVFNKVGSPQFMTWLIAPLAFGLVIDRRRWWKPAALGLGIAALTQVIYPIVYNYLTGFDPLTQDLVPQPWAVLLLTIRNAGCVVLLVWSVARMVQVPAPSRVAHASARLVVTDATAAAD